MNTFRTLQASFSSLININSSDWHSLIICHNLEHRLVLEKINNFQDIDRAIDWNKNLTLTCSRKHDHLTNSFRSIVMIISINCLLENLFSSKFNIRVQAYILCYNFSFSGAAGGKPLTDLDNVVLDIIGRDSVYLKGLQQPDDAPVMGAVGDSQSSNTSSQSNGEVILSLPGIANKLMSKSTLIILHNWTCHFHILKLVLFYLLF